MYSFWINIMFRLSYAAFFTFTASGQTENKFLFFLLGNLLVSSGFLSAKPHRSRRMSATKSHETKRRQYRKNLLLEEKNRMLAEKQDYEIYAATLKERNRIAREIHDNVGHLLSRSILITGAAKAINASDALSPVLDDLDHSLNQAMTSIRTSVHDLHDESLNLKEAAESLTSDFTFCPVTLNYDMGFEVPREIKYCFISIVKEALSNVARHSNATLVQITMREHPALYQLCIEDNGTLEEGIFLSKNNLEALFSNRGIGLSNMNDRLKILNGNLQITIQKGFRLFMTIPKEQEY